MENPHEASIPFMVTREMHQALADLGYPKEMRATFSPEEAQAIIKEQKYFRREVNLESKEDILESELSVLKTQWEDAFERMMECSTDEKSLEILKLTTEHTDPEALTEYLHSNANLIPEERYFLTISALIKELKQKIKNSR